MIRDFIISFRLKNTYRVNSIIFSLKQIPLISKILPDTLYASKGLKLLGSIISGIIEFCSVFVGKLLYLCSFFILPMSLMKNISTNNFINIFVFLSVAGALLNSNMFNPSKDKYYAMVLMRFDAKNYTLANYYYFLFKTLTGFLITTIIFGLLFKIDILVCVLLSVFVILIKCIVNNINIRNSDINEKVVNENLPRPKVIIITAVLLLLAYALPFLGYSISMPIFISIFTVSLILGVISIKYIHGFKNYKKLYKQLLIEDNIIFNHKAAGAKQQKKITKKQITYAVIEDTNKKGYEYFNDIFVKRHRGVLAKPTKVVSIIALIVYITAILACLIFKDFATIVNTFFTRSLPYFLLIMYFINRGESITRTMFMNCDQSMLHYRFYKQPGSILKLFKERLKTLIKLNLIPAFIIAAGSIILVSVTGTIDLMIYLTILLTIISMSVFFSIHYLVLYYLLQPYNADLQMKNPMFSIISFITYIICYRAMSIKMSVMTFGTYMIAFTIIYSLIALFLAHKYATKTFKLR